MCTEPSPGGVRSRCWRKCGVGAEVPVPGHPRHDHLAVAAAAVCCHLLLLLLLQRLIQCFVACGSSAWMDPAVLNHDEAVERCCRYAASALRPSDVCGSHSPWLDCWPSLARFCSSSRMLGQLTSRPPCALLRAAVLASLPAAARAAHALGDHRRGACQDYRTTSYTHTDQDRWRLHTLRSGSTIITYTHKSGLRHLLALTDQEQW
jgi:hypothetical protein